MLRLAANDREGMQHIGEAPAKAFGGLNSEVLRGNAAAVGCRNDIHDLQLIRHIVGTLDHGCFDPGAAACPLKLARPCGKIILL